jgi:NADH dehydrogenase
MVCKQKTAVVFGAAGFVGRYTVARLAKAGWQVRAAVRDIEGAKFLRPIGAEPVFAPLESAPATGLALAGAELAVNLVGILAQSRPGDFERVHALAAGKLAAQAASLGVSRFVQISAIGADSHSQSLYAQSKGRGEQAVQAAFPGAVILRPSIIFGPEDSFFNRFAAMAQIMPILPIVGGQTKFQPVYVGDVAHAIEAAATPGQEGKTFELGGPEILSFRDLVALTMRYSGQNRPIWDMPLALARLQAAILERLPGKLLTRDQIKLLARDNVVAPGAWGLAALGIAPTRIDQIMPVYFRAMTGA